MAFRVTSIVRRLDLEGIPNNESDAVNYILRGVP